VYWTGTTLDANMLANSKLARQIDSKAFNPTYTFTETTEQFSLGEVAAPIIVFGDMQSGTVDRAMVEFFFSKCPCDRLSLSSFEIPVLIICCSE
jgi:hypothetical protein